MENNNEFEFEFEYMDSTQHNRGNQSVNDRYREEIIDYPDEKASVNNDFMEPYVHTEELPQYFKEDIIQYDISGGDGPGNGQDKCPKCGATDISMNMKTGKLRCNFCRHEFDSRLVNEQQDISALEGTRVSRGAIDIANDSEDIITLKCSSCGAEVVIDTENSMQARCHWCRNTLSINDQIPNGSVPDMVLPFDVTKDEAQRLIDKFVKNRRFFAHPVFKKEFTVDNVMGVYFPYMVVDINAHAEFKGQAEHLVRRYTVGSGDNRRTRYDADLYAVEREFDLFIDDLTVESSADKLDKKSKNKTNNIVNSILPFDTENAVKWNANYLRGFTSEKRDVNIAELEPQVDIQARDIARFAANDSMQYYDRGACWEHQRMQILGQDWKSAHLPVWLYSYHQKKGGNSLLHYVVVNARTRETMGSVPIHQPKLLFFSALIEFFSFYATTRVDLDDGEFIFLTFGFIFYFFMYTRYRNNKARHTHELETKREVRNLRKADYFIKTRKGLSNERIKGENSSKVDGNKFL